MDLHHLVHSASNVTKIKLIDVDVLADETV